MTMLLRLTVALVFTVVVLWAATGPLHHAIDAPFALVYALFISVAGMCLLGWILAAREDKNR